MLVRVPALLALVGLTACSGSDAELPALPDSGIFMPPTGDPFPADLAIALVAPDGVGVGATLAYEIHVTNHGPGTASNASVTVEAPAGVPLQAASGAGWDCNIVAQKVTCARDALSVGDAPSISVTATAPAAAGPIAVTAAVQAATTDSNHADNTATATTQVLAATDLAIAVAGPTAPVPAGGVATYQITVTNHGPGASAGITVVDPLPTGAQFSSGSGDGWTCDETGGTVTCHKAALDASAASVLTFVAIAPRTLGALVNEFTVSALVPDPVSTNNKAQVTANVVAAADLAITQNASPDPVVLGQRVTYTIAVRNNGPFAADAVSAVDTLSSGLSFVSVTGSGWTCSVAAQVVTCTRARLEPDSAAPAITVVANVTPAAGASSTLITSARVRSSTLEALDQNNAVTTFTRVQTDADLGIVITDSADPIHTTAATDCTALDCVTYTIAVTNHGPAVAAPVDPLIIFPTAGKLVDIASAGWACTLDSMDRNVDCTRASLGVNETATITVRWRAPASVPSDPLRIEAVVFSADDRNSANDDVVETTAVVP